MKSFFNSHSSPFNGHYTILRHDENNFNVTWRHPKTVSGKVYMEGISIRYGGIAPMQSLLEQAGYSQMMEPDVNEDEFECEECHEVFDIEDSIKFQERYICPFCAEIQLRDHNRELSSKQMKKDSERMEAEDDKRN